MELDHEACYRAISTRDARFDGRIFIAVRTTRIYCRPICPARTPKRENVTFFTTASAAQEAGYRPCLRCRPESSPDLGATLEDAIAKLRSIRGIGEWTAQYIAMRVLREPDAFPAADIGLLRALTRAGEGRPSTAEVVERAEAWRPWRAYAAQHLWTMDARTSRANTRTSLKDNVDAHPRSASDPIRRSPRDHDRDIASHP
jgi:hypothetical protein